MIEGLVGRARAYLTDRGRLAVIAALVTIFALSIAVRWSHLDDPMGLHHEEGTGRTLVHSEAWWEDGPSAGGYLLRMTLNNPGDKFLTSNVDENGDSFYYSFPPGHPLWAFLAHRAIGVQPTVGSVRTFNLILNFISILLIYSIVRELLRRLPDTWSRSAALIGAAAYAFAPVVLWYQSNAYTSASAVQPLFLGALYATARAYRQTERPWVVPAVAGVLTFLACYTEWLGFAFAGVVVVAALVRRDDRILRRVAIAAAAGATGALVVVVVQYATQLGFAGVVDVFVDRYLTRSGTVATGGHTYTNPASWIRIGGMYLISLAPVAIVAALLWAWDRAAGRGKPGRFASGDAPTALIVVFSIAPVLVHHVVLFNHTAIHDFDMLKTAVFFSIAVGLLSGRLIARFATHDSSSISVPIVGSLVLVAVAIGASAWLYLDLNRPVTSQHKMLGSIISVQALDDEVVFIDAPAYLPPSITRHYSGRNFLGWKNDAEWAGNTLQRGGERTGILFVLNDQLRVQMVAYIGSDGAIYTTREDAQATLSAPSDPGSD